jgi:putative transposase
MARPPRLELPDSWHYVSNTSAVRQGLFRSDRDVEAFTSLLAETALRHGAVWHAFVLLDHSYHLLVHTAEANLQRIMRHINGVYTQHYQRQHNRSGNLFRQRYKSFLIDKALAQPLSGHLHRLLTDTLPADDAERSPRGSLRFSSGLEEAPAWFSTELTTGLKGRSRKAAYRQFLQEQADESIEDFINRHKQGTVLGDESFQRTAQKSTRTSRKPPARATRPDSRTILRETASFFGVKQRELMISTRGRGVESPARSVAMYLCQVIGGMTLSEVAETFSLAGYASAGSTIRNVRKRMDTTPELHAQVRALEARLLGRQA